MFFRRRILPRLSFLPAIGLLWLVSLAHAAPDVVLADFEGGTYGAWTRSGMALGTAPASGTLANQGTVTGFLGSGLVNTYLGGDATTGTLTSPAFTISCRYLCFLIGGGYFSSTRFDLSVDGQVVRTASGTNAGGGSEKLFWRSWDLQEFAGRAAMLKVTDQGTGGWGHINLDQIMLSDTPRGTIQTLSELPLIISRPYLNMRLAPQGALPTRLRLLAGTAADWEIPAYKSSTTQTLTWDVSRLIGQQVQLFINETPDAAGQLPTAQSLEQSDVAQSPPMVFDRSYEETYRPQFHFTPQINWMNDVNGPVYYAGEYHLFYQYDPWGLNGLAANKSWGHAVSHDLFHWRHLATALLPDTLGSIYSGTAVVDDANTAGFQTGVEKPLVAIYTYCGSVANPSQPYTQAIAYSLDRGRTWTKYAGNPVVPQLIRGNRDPKVFWHAATQRWVMVLYYSGNTYTILTSSNLKQWTRRSDVTMAGTTECPDFFEIPLDANPADTRWVFWGGNGNYQVGAFDGATFTTQTAVLPSEYGLSCYAGQTWNNIPAADSRRLFIGWMRRGVYIAMPFNQQLTVPREMTLRQTSAGPRLYMTPAREIKQLRSAGLQLTTATLAVGGANPLAAISGDCFDFDLRLKPGTGGKIELVLRGETLAYDAATARLSFLNRIATVPLITGTLTLRVLVDRTSVEVFANDGSVVMSFCFLPPPWDLSYTLRATGGSSQILSLAAYRLRSVWQNATSQASRSCFWYDHINAQ